MPTRKTSILMFAALLIVCAADSAVARTRKGVCPVPNGAKCMALTEVYERTNHADSVTDDAASKPAAASPRATITPATPPTVAPQPPKGPLSYRPVKHADAVPSGDTLAVIPSVQIAAAPQQAVLQKPIAAAPVRAPAKVMRIFISEWEDENGSLHMPGTIFTEIEPRRWSVGQPAITSGDDFRLLEGLGSKAANDSQAPASSANAAAPLSSK